MTIAEILDPKNKDKVARAIRKNYSKGYYFVIPQPDGPISFTKDFPPHIKSPLNLTHPKDLPKIIEILKESIEAGWEY